MLTTLVCCLILAQTALSSSNKRGGVRTSRSTELSAWIETEVAQRDEVTVGGKGGGGKGGSGGSGRSSGGDGKPGGSQTGSGSDSGDGRGGTKKGGKASRKNKKQLPRRQEKRKFPSTKAENGDISVPKEPSRRQQLLKKRSRKFGSMKVEVGSPGVRFKRHSTRAETGMDTGSLGINQGAKLEHGPVQGGRKSTSRDSVGSMQVDSGSTNSGQSKRGSGKVGKEPTLEGWPGTIKPASWQPCGKGTAACVSESVSDVTRGKYLWGYYCENEEGYAVMTEKQCEYFYNRPVIQAMGARWKRDVTGRETIDSKAGPGCNMQVRAPWGLGEKQYFEIFWNYYDKEPKKTDTNIQTVCRLSNSANDEDNKEFPPHLDAPTGFWEKEKACVCSGAANYEGVGDICTSIGVDNGAWCYVGEDSSCPNKRSGVINGDDLSSDKWRQGEDHTWSKDPCVGKFRGRASNWQCHHYTDQEKSMIGMGQSEAEVCAQTGGHVFTGGKNTNYVGCAGCFCCKPQEAPASRNACLDNESTKESWCRADYIQYCDRWADQGACEGASWSWMSACCKKSCNTCSINSAGSSIETAVGSAHPKPPMLPKVLLPREDSEEYAVAQAPDRLFLTSTKSTGSCPAGTALTEYECQYVATNFGKKWGGAKTDTGTETCGCYVDNYGGKNTRYFNRNTQGCNSADEDEKVICKGGKPASKGPQSGVCTCDLVGALASDSCRGGGNDDGCDGVLDIGMGDCDKDEDCASGLLCGTDNCEWNGNDDCCYDPKFVLDPFECTMDVCAYDLYQEGRDWWDVPTAVDSCYDCMQACLENPNCGAADCGEDNDGDGYCMNWAVGRCPHGVEQASRGYRICRKNSVSKDKYLASNGCFCDNTDSDSCKKTGNNEACDQNLLAGQGHCTTDWDCAGSLVCGIENCEWNALTGETDNCCVSLDYPKTESDYMAIYRSCHHEYLLTYEECAAATGFGDWGGLTESIDDATCGCFVDETYGMRFYNPKCSNSVSKADYQSYINKKKRTWKAVEEVYQTGTSNIKLATPRKRWVEKLTTDGTDTDMILYPETSICKRPGAGRQNWQCTESGCDFDGFTEGVDYGTYAGMDGSCEACLEKCDNDNNCGGFECGDGDCVWWAGNKCSIMETGYHQLSGMLMCRNTMKQFTAEASVAEEAQVAAPRATAAYAQAFAAQEAQAAAAQEAITVHLQDETESFTMDDAVLYMLSAVGFGFTVLQAYKFTKTNKDDFIPVPEAEL